MHLLDLSMQKQNSLNRKVIAKDIIIVVLICLAGTGVVFAANWVYSNIIRITGVEPVIVLSSDAGDSPMVNQTFILTATLTLSGAPLSGKTLQFWEDNLPIGTAITDYSGTATLTWTVKSGPHEYKAGYEVV